MATHPEKIRQSNIELLRLVAMFLIVTIHANFFSLGRPTYKLLEAAPVATSLRYVLQSTCIIGVNLFVLISGYFGIHTRMRSVAGFLFTVLFYALLMMGLMAAGNWCVLGDAQLTSETALRCLRIVSKYNWFIPAYLGLMLLAPVLNAYTAHASQRQQGMVIITFAALSVYIGFFTEAAPDYGHGHSVLHFLLVYLIGHYVHQFPTWLNRRSLRVDGWQFLLCVALNSAIAIARIRTPFHPAMFTVDNPLVLYGALCVFLFFTKLHFQSKVVNRLALGAFAVFLIQMHPMVYPAFRLWVQHLHKQLGVPAFLLATLLTILGLFALALLLDVGRRALWKKLEAHLPK